MPRITRIRGQVPREKGCSLPPEFAEKAQNLNLTTGRYEPWFAPVQVIQFPFNVQTAHIRDCCWGGVDHEKARYVDAGFPEKTYLSVPDCRPMVTECFCNQHWCFAGIPIPGSPIGFVDHGVDVCDGPDSELVRYRLTYSKGCDEGPASKSSPSITWQKGALVAIALPEAPEEQWCVDTVNIYRQQSLWDATQGLTEFRDNEISSGWTNTDTDTDWFRVAQLPITERGWLDDVDVPGPLLTTGDYFPPAEGLIIVGETQQGSLIGYQECHLWISERNRHYAWPLKSRHSFEHTIRDVCVSGNDIFVFTEHSIYNVIDEAECQDATCRAVSMLDSEEPIVAGDHSVLDTGQGCVFVGNKGLYRISRGTVGQRVNQLRLSKISNSAFSEHDWYALNPCDIHLGVAYDNLIISNSNCSWAWPLSFDEAGNLPPDLTQLTIVPEQWLTDGEGAIYFLHGNCAYQFNASPERMDGLWKQSPQRSEDRQVTSSVYAQYPHKKQGNKLVYYNESKPVLTKPLREGITRFRGQASRCYQLQMSGPEPVCDFAYGAGINRFGGEQ